MAKDGLLPAWMGKTNSKEVPVISIILTGSFMAISILLLNLTNLMKAASTMMLILFLLVNLSLILMRESRIVERMAAREIRGTRLSKELSEILWERDGIDEDQFNRLIRKAIILDIPGKIPQSILFEKLADVFFAA